MARLMRLAGSVLHDRWLLPDHGIEDVPQTERHAVEHRSDRGVASELLHTRRRQDLGPVRQGGVEIGVDRAPVVDLGIIGFAGDGIHTDHGIAGSACCDGGGAGPCATLAADEFPHPRFPAMTDPIVVGTGIVKRYGANTVLDHTDITVNPGVTGLLGANGAGKTTMLGLFLGLHAADAGTLQILGGDPRTAGPALRARIGYSPEHHNLPPDLPATDFVQHIAEVHGMPTVDAVGRASDALWFVGMGEERTRPLGTLSTGQRQRVKLAMAIAHDPDLVLLDEPTDGLDPTQRETMLDLIRRLSADFGMNVLLSSHLLDEVERTCNQVVILKDGRVTAAGDIDDLKGVGKGMTVEVDWGADVLADRFRSRGLDVAQEASRLVVTIPAELGPVSQEDLFRVARDDLSELALPVRRLQNRTVSLEEVFMEVGV